MLTRFELTSSNNKLRVTSTTDASSPLDVTLTADTYYLSTDDATTAGKRDFVKALVDALNAATASVVFSIQVYGVDVTSADHADGRLKISADGGGFSLLFADATNTTLDPRILGFPAADAGTTNRSTALGLSVLSSEYVHRYGWYPQRDPIDDEAGDVTEDVSVSRATDRTIDLVSVGGGDYTSGILTFEQVQAALVRTKSATGAARAANVNTTAGDENCSFEAFVGDAKISRFRFYPDTTAATTADFSGPYQLRPETGIYTRATSTVSDIGGSDASTIEIPFEDVP